MTVFSKRNVLLGIATLTIFLGTSVAIWGLPRFMKRTISIKSQVSLYLLDDRGAVNGLLLASGDQIHFGAETGNVITSRIKPGDEVTVTGHAGKQTSYGRELKAEQISFNGQTITAVHAGPKGPHEDRNHGGPKDRKEQFDPLSDFPTSKTNVAPSSTPAVDPNAQPGASPAPVSAQTVVPEAFKATGIIRTHLVNGPGDVDGLILSNGEQIRLSPKIGKLVIAAEQGTETQVSVEGTVVRNERGVVIRPTIITVGNQTFTLDQ